MGRLLGSAAMAAVLAAGAAGPSAGASGAAVLAHHGSVSARPAAVAPGGLRPVLLVNGDRLLAGPTPRGGFSHVLTGAPAPGAGGALTTLTLGGKTYVIPADAFPYLGRGLSPSLFDLGSLRQESAGSRLPVQLSYAGRVPSLPGVTITSAAGRTARGYLTAASARVFGAALARQFAADHARASYGQDGMFAGQVSISLPGVTAARKPSTRQTAVRPAPVRPATGPGAAGRDFPMQTLTVTATDLAGRPDTGDGVEVLNVDNLLKFGDPRESSSAFYHGVTKFSVPAGHYWAVGFFGSARLRMVVLPQFTVGGATTVHMSEQAASSPVREIVPRPTQLDYTRLVLGRFTAAGQPAFVDTEVFQSGTSLWVSPTSTRPTVGTLQSFTATQLDSPPGAPGTPYEYGLAYNDTSGLVPPQRHVVNPATLAHVRARYYQAAPAQVQQVMTVSTTQLYDLTGFAGRGDIFQAPAAINEYLTADHTLVWVDQYFQQAALYTQGGGQSEFGRTFAPGQRATENWGEFPLHVAPNDNLVGGQNPDQFLDASATRAGDTMGFYLTPFSMNQPGYTGTGFLRIPGVTFSGRYALDENGTQIASGDATRPVKINGEFGTSVTVSPTPAVYRLSLTARRSGPGYPLSSASSTAWTWRSAHEAGNGLPPGWWCPAAARSRACAVQPLMTLQYAVQGMTLTGAAPAGPQVLRLYAGHLPLAANPRVTGLTVTVSLDGGKTWQPAQVSGGNGRYSASYTAPAGAMVTLRTSATDAAGGAITETLTNAYQT
jgi:hypothetical protein